MKSRSDGRFAITGLMLLVIVVTVATNVYLFMIIPKGFFPEQDTGRISGTIQADQDISFQSMYGEAETDPSPLSGATPRCSMWAGSPAAAEGADATNTGRMFISLKPFKERKATVTQVIARLRKKLAGIPGAPTYFQPVQDLRIGGRMANAMYQYTLQGDNLADLVAWAPRVEARLRTLPALIDVSSDQQNKGLDAYLVIDRHTASRLGITPQAIDNILYDAFGQRQVSITYTQLNQYHVVMEVAPRVLAAARHAPRHLCERLEWGHGAPQRLYPFPAGRDFPRRRPPGPVPRRDHLLQPGPGQIAR